MVQVTTRPGTTIEASQQVLIEALPPILVLHLKRFLYDTGVGGVVKVGRQIRFGPELEVGHGAFSLVSHSSSEKNSLSRWLIYLFFRVYGAGHAQSERDAI